VELHLEPVRNNEYIIKLILSILVLKNFFLILDTIHKMNKYILVLEYADSGTLNNYLKNHFNKLDWIHKFELARQLASAVACIHEEGIIHRDLVIFVIF